MQRLLAALMVVSMCIMSCTRNSARTPSEGQLTLAALALSQVLSGERHSMLDSIAICLPSRAKPSEGFLQRFRERQISVSPCSFRPEHRVLREFYLKAVQNPRWELDVVMIEQSASDGKVGIMVTEPKGYEGGYYFFEFEREGGGWVLVRCSFGIS